MTARAGTQSAVRPWIRRAGEPAARTDQQIVMRDLKEGIGIALDVPGDRMYVTDLGGTVYSAQA